MRWHPKRGNIVGGQDDPSVRDIDRSGDLCTDCRQGAGRGGRLINGGSKDVLSRSGSAHLKSNLLMTVFPSRRISPSLETTVSASSIGISLSEHMTLRMDLSAISNPRGWP